MASAAVPLVPGRPMTPDSAALWIVLGVAAEVVVLITWAVERLTKRLRDEPPGYSDTSRGTRRG